MFKKWQWFLPPSEGKKSTLSLCFRKKETTVRVMDASGNFKMKAIGGGGRADIEPRHNPGIQNANDRSGVCQGIESYPSKSNVYSRGINTVYGN